MRATINREGTLQIISDNDLEAYALKKWWDDFENKNVSTLQVITDEQINQTTYIPRTA